MFHLHTPASYDYCLYEENRELSEDNRKNYKNLLESELYEIAIKEDLFINEIKIEDIKYNKKIFEDLKEYISYLLIAHKIIINDIKTVVISDHNTIDGYKKILQAIDDYTKNKFFKVYPEIILGIEISCADLNHIVSILPRNKYEDLNKFIEEYIMDRKKGTYLSSIDVIEKISKIEGISYIAHINTSNIFKKDFLSDGYKEKLFSLPELKLIGISKEEESENIKKQLKKYTNKEFGFVLDADSHSIDTIDKKIFWIKGTKSDYRIIKDIVKDYEVTVQLKQPGELNKVIKGIIIENDENNFLISKNFVKNNEKYLVINFSTSTNCIIGGRGTGKSTILNILQFALGLKVKNRNDLEMICKHKNIWVIYRYEKRDYIIKLTLPKKEYEDDDIIKCFEDLPYGGDCYNRKYYWDEEKIKKYTIRHYIKMYYVQDEGGIKEYTGAKLEILKEIFKEGYVINELVNIAGSNRINNYIQNLIFENEKLSNNFKIPNANSLKNLKENIKLVKETKIKRKAQVEKILGEYNDKNKHKIIITYKQEEDYNVKYIISNNSRMNMFVNKNGKRYNILLNSIDDYFNALISKIGILETLDMLVNKNIVDIEKELKIQDFAEEFSQECVDKGIADVNKDNSHEVLGEIVNTILGQGAYSLNNILKDYLNDMEQFSIQFNVNSNKNNLSIEYRNIDKLSLGQKVVAMLTFILSYSEFSEDYTPLIIDQPEDNLDSQYIYGDLVSELRKMKEKRQIIIATHNSTIVTNSKTENVIIMKSNNQKGWIERSGYPTEHSILNGILNYLEGGKDSFKHKQSLYEDVL